MNYTRAAAATDVTVQAYRSPTLAAGKAVWTRDGVTETMISDDGKTQHWQATTQGDSSAFLRLQVTAH